MVREQLLKCAVVRDPTGDGLYGHRPRSLADRWGETQGTSGPAIADQGLTRGAGRGRMRVSDERNGQMADTGRNIGTASPDPLVPLPDCQGVWLRRSYLEGAELPASVAGGPEDTARARWHTLQVELAAWGITGRLTASADGFEVTLPLADAEKLAHAQ